MRVFSPAARASATALPVNEKELVNIESIVPQGQYAIRIRFDDGHDSGIYSWDTLYELGSNQDAKWRSYMEQVNALGHSRADSRAQVKRLKLLYFAWLARKLRVDAEEVDAPAAVTDVDGLLRWLGLRRSGAAPLFDPERLSVTVNKEFAQPFAVLDDGDEVALVPKVPAPPATPDLI